MRRLAIFLLYLCSSVLIGDLFVSCDRKHDAVTLYTSVDQPIAAKIVAAFEKQTGIHVVLKTDAEATKSIGLAERLRAEKANPIADVFWSNEVFHAVNLADEGLFVPLTNVPADIPAAFKDERDRWAGVGLRARVLAVAVGQRATSIDDLLDPRFKGKVALARPLAGTTAGHVAALYALWGEAKADDFFRKLRDNGALLLGGNGPVAESVGGGNVLVGLTDNDDCVNAIAAGGRLTRVLPDQSPDGIGTLAIPTTVALVAHPHVSNSARQLAAYLLSAENERRLIDENFCAFSVRASPASLHVMNVKYADVASLMTTAPKRATDLLDGRVK